MGKNDKRPNAIEKIKFEVGQEMGLSKEKSDAKSKKNFNKL
ncbi:MAG: hypothetical protein ABFC94_15430 [Syntrophomonas sp.]